MATPRGGASGALLNDGRFLVLGGSNGPTVVNTAELYTPAFRPTGVVGIAKAVASDVIGGTCILVGSTLDASTCSVTVTPAVVAGTHTITATYNDDGVHAGSSDAKDLTVVKGTPTIDWATPGAITYGTALDGTQLNATASYHSSPLPGSFVYTPASGEVLAAGPHTLHVDFTPDDPDDYESASKDVSLTVNTKPLTITANDQSKTYGAAFTFAGTEFAPVGLTNGDTIATVTLTSAGAAATATVTAPGPTYPIAPSAAVFGTGNASNYSISYVDGTLTVNPRPATVAADPKSKTYGDDNPTLTATVTGTVNGDVLNYTLATTALKFSQRWELPDHGDAGQQPATTPSRRPTAR